MIKISDATLLAYTKLRTRKLRLGITVIISALLFSGLIAASLISRGAFASIASFNKEGLGERFILNALPQSGGDIFTDPALTERAAAIQKELIARKKAEAKKLGIEYSAEGEQPAVSEFDTPGGKSKSINPDHPAAQQAIKEFMAKQSTPGLPELEALAKPYGAKAFYEQRAVTSYSGGASLQVLKDGKESYKPASDSPNQFGPPTGTDSFVSSWNLMSKELIQPFVLPEASLDMAADGAIPVAAPYSAIEQLLKLPALPASANPDKRLARLKEVRSKAKDLKFAVCYRNKTSASLMQQAVSTQEEIDRNKNKKDYQKPSLIYGLPGEACGPVVTVTDKRTADEKQTATKQETFRQIFGEPPAKQQILSFRIIGVVPDPPSGSASVVTQLISGLVASSIGIGWFSPIETEQIPIMQEIQAAKPPIAFGPDSYFVELSTADQAKKFIEEKNCAPDFSIHTGPPTEATNPITKCLKNNQPFALIPFGSSSLALDGAKKRFASIFSIAAIIFALLASLIMMGIVGRTIADSRRETAVFRAIGAKRMDIIQIYITYAIFLGILIGIVALVGGLIMASLANARWAEELTVSALVAYNANDLNKDFVLYGLSVRDLLYILGLLLAAGVLSSIFPLLRNARRNPISDMRDET